MKHLFIDKTIFFQEHGILVIGDLHLGYEEMFRVKGYSIPKGQLNDMLSDLKKILDNINKSNYELKKVIFMGDMKHFFSYEKTEGSDFNEIIELLNNKIDLENIILIKGNHDTFEFSGIKMRDFFIEDGIIFSHGHKFFEEMLSKEVKTIVLSHIHPAITLRDSQNIKRENYKCFLEGKWKNKEVIIVPSFFNIVEGTNILSGNDQRRDFFIISDKEELENFIVYIIGDDGVYNFGKLRDLKSNP
jgi:putative SbcD/Mre11-related phosphoesterase